jgi:multidrug efflux pump subunit AcrB
MGGIFFNRFGSRQWQVMASRRQYRGITFRDTEQFCVRNRRAMVPLSALTKFRPRFGPEYIMHYNEYPSAQIQRHAAPG